MKRLITTILILSLASVTISYADLVDPDAFASGTVLNNAYAGVTLSALGSYSGADGNVYARTSSLASTGTNVFGSSWSLSFEQWGFETSYQPHLRVDFDVVATYVAIDAIGNNSEDYGRLEAYNSIGTLIGVYETGLLQIGDIETMTITSPDIAYILVAGKNPGYTPWHTVHLDNLQFEPVPVPGAVLLGMIGLSVAGIKLRKHA